MSKKANHVILLEARDRIGSRIHIIVEKTYDKGIELGAEFIFGDPALHYDYLENMEFPIILSRVNCGVSKMENSRKPEVC